MRGGARDIDVALTRYVARPIAVVRTALLRDANRTGGSGPSRVILRLRIGGVIARRKLHVDDERSNGLPADGFLVVVAGGEGFGRCTFLPHGEALHGREGIGERLCHAVGRGDGERGVVRIAPHTAGGSGDEGEHR